MGASIPGAHRAWRVTATFLLLSASTAALAQAPQAGTTAPPPDSAPAEASRSQLEDIVVTARRRSESLQDTPVAVTSFSADAIDRKFATDIRALAGEVPNVVITNVPGFNAASIGIRGQSTGDIILTFEPAVGVIVDDFVLAHVQTQLFDLFASSGSRCCAARRARCSARTPWAAW